MRSLHASLVSGKSLGVLGAGGHGLAPSITVCSTRVWSKSTILRCRYQTLSLPLPWAVSMRCSRSARVPVALPQPCLYCSTTALHYSTAALSTPTKQPACPPLLAQTSAKCQCYGSSRWTCSPCGRRSGRSSTGATTEFREPIARTVRAVPVPEGHWIRLIVGLPDRPLELSSHCPKVMKTSSGIPFWGSPSYAR